MAGVTRKTVNDLDLNKWVQITKNIETREWHFAIGDTGKFAAYDTATFRIDSRMQTWENAILHATYMLRHC